ncbi:STAS-like domain-containing protein [Pseudomonas monteilii]|uniref:DUF4325 domain-containing protein n=1 Tax=Pseudomonas monteilii TaxID=76759 RepID=A0A399MBF5_9PSED|nr:STAS-like domain-containing protein [Pseudomonas monteilii]RII79140.1 DUF4325 domain-containing protein [Pseudomonas monteilii]
MNRPHRIDVAERFSDMPYGRDDKDGDDNGLRFRKDVLLPALKDHEYIIIDLNGTMGCGSSFGDEAFAGLIIYEGFRKEDVLRRISFDYKYKSVINNIIKYIEEAKPRD